MKPSTVQRVLVVLVCIGAIGATSLIAMNVFRKHNSGGPESAGVGGVIATPGQLDPPVLGAVPDFSLIDHHDKAATLADMRDKVWIANFIFTRCASTCPMMTWQMRRLHEQLRTHERFADIGFVSISVDPENDTPEVFRNYLTGRVEDDTQWRFLTGKRGDIWPLIVDGFRLPVEEDHSNPVMPILHSEKFVIVDQQGRIRGYYDGLKKFERQRLMRDLQRVLAE